MLQAAAEDGQRERWRERALVHVRARHAEPEDTLVRLSLAEGDISAALAIAEHARMPLHTWARLGARRREGHPAMAQRIFRTLVQSCVERTSKQGYREAMECLGRMRPLHRQLGSEAEFDAYLDTLRNTYRAKKCFVETLDGLRDLTTGRGEFDRSQTMR